MPSDIVKLNECSTLDGTQYLVDEDLHGAKVLRSGHFLPDGSVVLTHEEAALLCNLLLGLETLGHQPESCRHWYELISGKFAEE